MLTHKKLVDEMKKMNDGFQKDFGNKDFREKRMRFCWIRTDRNKQQMTKKFMKVNWTMIVSRCKVVLILWSSLSRQVLLQRIIQKCQPESNFYVKSRSFSKIVHISAHATAIILKFTDAPLS